MIFVDYIMTNIQNIRLTKIVSYVPTSQLSDILGYVYLMLKYRRVNYFAFHHQIKHIAMNRV